MSMPIVIVESVVKICEDDGRPASVFQKLIIGVICDIKSPITCVLVQNP